MLEEIALRRSTVYTFLSSFYNAVPKEEFVAKLMSESFMMELMELSKLADGEIKEGTLLLDQFITLNRDKDLEKLTDELAVEFTRLFRGIKEGYSPPPPYESVYLGEGRVMGLATQRVMRLYLRAGLALMEEYGGPPDYIGTELKFLALTSYREAESWKKNDREEAIRLLRVQKSFLEEHVLAWIPKFCDVVLKEAESDFYRGVAKLTRGYLRLDAEQVKEILKAVEGVG